MAQQLGLGAVNWVTRVARAIAPWALGLIVFLVSLTAPNENPIAAVEESYNYTEIEFLGLIAFSIASGVAAGLARRWIWPLFVITAIGWMFLSIYPTVMVSSYYAAVRLTRRRHAIAFLGVVTTMVAIPLGIALGGLGALGALILVPIAIALLVGLPYSIGLWVSARRQVIAGLQERAARLEREQAARADRARAEERARIAREMHDVVAHRVALMVLHAGALEVNAPTEQLAGEAALVRNTGREALTELRQVLGVLRTEGSSLTPQPDLSDVEHLLDQARAAGLPVRYTEAGSARPLPLVVQRTAYRIIQEALTNVVKHTGGADTEVTLRYLHNNLEVRVENGPPHGPGDRLPGSGLGLVGLYERVALLYGRFESRPRLDGGFIVCAFLPDQAEEVPT